ncbi:uncharacterized protein LOC114299016 [Camellia sinensis]|uniref:uncharacterized protein LOC114299016 n=1 Tax=Camellia sinensis TaxID=4442 RepID=UPI001035F8B1|nr:uncharacterized protein LOC114299016 [Camellia sinensis]
MKLFIEQHCKPTRDQNSRHPYLRSRGKYIPFKNGSMHDSRIFKEIIENQRASFPHPPEGKYYLVDVRYPNKKGYLAPFKGSRYHQALFREYGRPDNPREMFNEAHVSLRSVVERTFGVWKSRWKFLHNMPDYDFATVQVPLVGASMALHSFIRRHELAALGNDRHYVVSSVLDGMPDVHGGRENLDDGLIVGDTNVDMARVHVRIRNHLFYIRNLGLL